MNRRSVLLGSVMALIAPVLPAWATVFVPAPGKPDPARAGLGPHYPDRNEPWAHDCLRWRGRVLTGERAHWCWDWDGLPVDETTPEHATCICEWQHLDPAAKLPPQALAIETRRWGAIIDQANRSLTN